MLKVAVIGFHWSEWIPVLESEVTTPIEVVFVPSFDEATVARAVADVDVIISDRLTVAMGRAAKRVRLVHMPGAGYDKFQAGSIPEGAYFCNCYEHENAIGEWIMMMCLALSRQLLLCDAQLRQGDWSMYPVLGAATFLELSGRTIGFAGLGRVGRAAARMAGAFGMRRIGVDVLTIPSADIAEAGLEWVGGLQDMDRVLSQTDFLVVALPLLAETHSMIGARELGLMKPTAYLINAARALVVDEGALYEALRDRRIAGAALDVWYNYPKGLERTSPAHHPFHSLSNVILTAHNSGWTHQTIERRWRVVADNIDRLARGEPLVHVVTEMSRAPSEC